MNGLKLYYQYLCDRLQQNHVLFKTIHTFNKRSLQTAVTIMSFSTQYIASILQISEGDALS